ncbi:hypothetical protein GCM10022255_070860 [Dactylosporangium darangshiense]|uniref:Integral membrane protein n=2 Tax=Dactylosporangium darangshiense TaxID=579108 RepID=A0ABP8DJ78_9ACTN
MRAPVARSSVDAMRWVLVIVGVLLVLSGAVWTLQGLNVLGGSAMSGATMWAIIGPLVAVVGLVLLISGVRRFRA